MTQQTEYQFYDLLSAKLSGDATTDDWARLNNLLHQYPDFQFLYDEIIKPVEFPPETNSLTQQAYAALCAKKIFAEKNKTPEIPSKPEKSPNGTLKMLKIIAALAACVILLLTSKELFTGLQPHTLPKSATTGNNKYEMITTKGSKSKITLPDGTRVTLNADSKLSYGHNFSQQNREVTLTGEGFFDVKHDTANPFVIHTGMADVKVLGTSFNVRSYPNSAFETSLLRGSIEVTLKNQPEKKIVLNPSQKITITDSALRAGYYHTEGLMPPPGDYTVEVTPVTVQDSSIAEVSWMSNKLIFANQPLQYIALELERQFNIQVIFNSEDAKHYRYTGVFENQRLNEVLQILKLSKNINYKIKDDVLMID